MTTQRDRSVSKPETPKKFQRTSTGCFNCRKKKKKCDGTRPVCNRCKRVNLICEFPRLKFFQCKADNTDASNSSAKKTFTNVELFTTQDQSHIQLDTLQAPQICTSHGPSSMSSKPTILTLNMRATKRKSFTEKKSLIPISKSEADDLYLKTIPVSYVRRLITSSAEELEEYKEEMNKIIDVILEKSFLNTKDMIDLLPDLNKLHDLQLDNNLSHPTPVAFLEKPFIEMILKTQSILPKVVTENIEYFAKIENDSNGTIMLSLNLWCYFYIHFCNATLKKKFSDIDFYTRGEHLLHFLLRSQQNSVNYESHFVSCCLILFSLILISTRKPLWHEVVALLKSLVDDNGGTMRLCQDERLKILLSYTLYIDLTSTYAPYTGTNFSQTDFQIVFDSPIKKKVNDNSSFFEDNCQLLKLYYDISRLSSLVNVADDEIDLRSILLEAEYLEKQLGFITLDISNVKSEKIRNEKLLIFKFYKDVGHLYILQCIHRRQSLSIETMLVARKLLSRVNEIVTSPYCSGFASFPLFILSVDIATFETRSWMIHQLCRMWELTQKPNLRGLIQLLKDVWMVNPDGFKFAFWPEIIAKNQYIVSLT